MDNLIAESSDVMVNSMNFGLPETAQYVTGRRLVNYFPSQVVMSMHQTLEIKTFVS